MRYSYDISFAHSEGVAHARRWMLLAVAALAISGIAPLLLLAGRASFLAEKELVKALFHQVLVVHVDLSVLVWFLAIAAMWFALLADSTRAGIKVPYLAQGAVCSFALGGVLIAISPVNGGEALMSNYIPVITNGLFFIGLSLILTGMVLSVVQLMLGGAPQGFSLGRCFSSANSDAQSAMVFGIISTAMILLIALLCFLFTSRMLPDVYEGQDHYEMLFWAGGHVLQFAYTQMLLMAWLVVASAMGAVTSLKPNRLCILFAFNLALALLSPLAFFCFEFTSFEFKDFYTQLMRGGGGIAALVVGAYVLVAMLKMGNPSRERRVLFYVLAMSFMLFAAGGGIGYMIAGSNTIIPAHYHGSIIGTSLAFMGVIYVLLPHFGGVEVSRYKMAVVQPLLLGAGQLMHVIGFAWAGGYGVMRKTPGELGEGFTQAKAAMQLMRLGGLVAVVGGALFVIVVIRSLRAGRKTH